MADILCTIVAYTSTYVCVITICVGHDKTEFMSEIHIL